MKLRRDCDLYQGKKTISAKTNLKSDLYHFIYVSELRIEPRYWGW